MEYRTIIYNAARDGNLRRLKVFLDSKGKTEVETLLTVKTFGTPPIVIAARNGHADVIRYLIEREASVNLTGTVTFDGEKIEGAPPLWAAAAAGHFEIVQILVENGANVNQTTLTNSTPLRGACFDGHLDIVKYLVEHGADIEIANRHGHTCLMIAAYRCQVEIVQYLLRTGANVNKRSLKGNTALHDAAEAGSLDIIQLLLDAGAYMQRDFSGLSPMLSAASLGHSVVVEFLADAARCSWREQVDGLQLLGATCIDKRRDLVGAINYWRRALTLLESSQEEEMECSREETQAYGYQREVRSAAKLEEIASDPDALRMQALLIRERILGPAHADTVYYLRYRGAIYADVGRFDRCIELWMHALRMQQKALEPLCSMTHGTIVSFAELFAFMLNDYISAGQERGRENAPLFVDIHSVLHIAVEEVRRGMDTLNQEEANDDSRACIGRLCSVILHLVCLICRLDTKVTPEDHFQLRTLLYKLVRMDPRDAKGQALLHLVCSVETSTIGRFPVCRFPALNVCQLLLELKADPNARDQEDRTPLHVILKNRVGRPSIVRTLLDAGAHIDQRSKANETPLDLLKHEGTTDIPLLKHLSLKCLAASAVRQFGMAYNEIPRQLVPFVDIH